MRTNFLFTAVVVLVCCLSSCKYSKQETTLKDSKAASPVLNSVYINGDSIHYMDVGKGETIVFVHGGLGDYRSWSGQVDTFSVDHRVITYSRRYAYPNKQVINDSADYTVLPHVKDLAELIKTLEIGPVHLVGHSWGAFTSLKTTIDHPELVKSLVLAEPPVHSLIRNTKLGDSLINNLIEGSFKTSANAFKNNQNEKGVSLFIGGVMGDSLIFSKVPEFVRERWMQNTLGLRGHVINVSFIPIPSEDIQKVTTPVLVIKGEVSPLYFKEIADRLDSLLPNNELYVLPKASHGMQGDNPEAFNNTVLNFIGATSGGN